VLRNILLSHGLQQPLLSCTFFAAVLNAALNMLLIPRYTYMGSAAAMVVTEAFLLILVHLHVARRVVPMHLASHLWKPLAACVPMVIVVTQLPGSGVVLRIAAGIAVYLLAARLMRAFRIGEIAGIFSEAVHAPGNI
jgi:O-antigen/teichoic acid export membrane protein